MSRIVSALVEYRGWREAVSGWRDWRIIWRMESGVNILI